MPLLKQKLSISFAEGLDTKTDDKQVINTRLLELENAVFTKGGSLNKRFGYDILSQSIENSLETVSSGAGLTNFKDELILFDGTKLYSFLDANEKWQEKGNLVSVKTSTSSVVRNPYQQTTADYATDGATSVFIWEDSRGGCRYSVLDENSGTFIISDVQYTSSGEKPKVFLLENNFILTFIDGTTIKYRTIPVATPSTINAEVTPISNLDPTDKVYDAKAIQSRVYFVYNNADGGGGVSIRYLLANLVISNEVKEAGEEAQVCAAVIDDSSAQIWASYYNGTAVKSFAYDRDLTTQLLAPTVVETVADVRNITAAELKANTINVLYEISNTVGSNKANFLKVNTIDTAATVGTAQVLQRSVGLASKLFSRNGEDYFVAVNDSDLQSTYFTFSISGDLISKISTTLGGGYTAKSLLPEVIEKEPGVFKTATLKKAQLLSEGGNLFTRLGVEAAEFDFVSPNNFLTAELGNNLHIIGGVLQMYDGVNVVEQGFSLFPEGVTLAETSPGAGTIANGTYQYSVVYAWIDNQGQLHRSAPSIAESITVAAGPSSVTVTVPTLRITKKEDAFIEVYRTEASGTIFYKVTTVDSPVLNDKTVDTVAFVDTVTDANLISNEVLYTTGGVLDNIATPAASLITTFKSRLFVNDLDDDNVIRYSKIRGEGFPVEFNDTLIENVDSKGGPITALKALDDKLIIFKQNAIFFIAGEGPNNLGLQNDFLRPQLVTSDVGCIDPNSVVDMPLGLMFQSSKGIYLLSRGLTTDYVGAPVERFNDTAVSGAVLVPDTNQVRFTTENNLCLVYDYFYRQWSTFTNHEAQGAVSYENLFTFVKTDGRVFQENKSKFTDGADSVKMKLVTAWIQLAGLTGFQRVYRAQVLGDFKSDHKLRVKVGYNYNPVFIQETLIDAGTILATNNYGNGSPYGTGDNPYGGEYPAYNWRLQFKRQKCASIRLSFEDVQVSDFGEGYSISNLSLEIGGKRGLFKTEDSRTFGPTE